MKRSPGEAALSSRRITRRGLLLGSAQAGVAGMLGYRMWSMQTQQADQYRLLAEENRISIRLIPPIRGQIFDRDGTPIAVNEPVYRIVMVREDAGDVDAVIARLSRLVELDDEDLNRALTEMQRLRPFVAVTIADRVSWDAVSRVAANAPSLPGISPEVGLSRRYPLGSDFGHIVGYVGPVSERDLERYGEDDGILRTPRFQIGKVGVESKLELPLRGKAGARRVEVNSIGRVMRELDRREGISGDDLSLSVDHQLQNYVQARLHGESASAVVIDVTNGDLLAIASEPTYDPNLFVQGISIADYALLRDNDHRPLASKTVQDGYPPGSTFKMITALAALEEGVISPNDTVYCKGYLEISDRRANCWKRSGHGSMDLNTSLRESCDVYYYELALKVGIEKITEMARRFGLGERTGVPMSAEISGIAPTKEWKNKNRGDDWVIGDTVNASIGQGFVVTSPLQLAVMTARLATGKVVEPRLIRAINGVETPSGVGADLGVNPENLRQVQRAMFSVANHRRGTAYRSRIADKAMAMAGKTGTSQVLNRVVRNDDVPWEQRDHALFVDYAPYNDPRIAVAVVVEHGGGGSQAAAPIARDITLQALHGGTPPLSAYPASDQRSIRQRQEEIEKLRRKPTKPEATDQA